MAWLIKILCFHLKPGLAKPLCEVSSPPDTSRSMPSLRCFRHHAARRLCFPSCSTQTAWKPWAQRDSTAAIIFLEHRRRRPHGASGSWRPGRRRARASWRPGHWEALDHPAATTSPMVAGHPRPCPWLHATNSPIAATNLDELVRRSVSSFSQLDAALHTDEHRRIHH
jgi:hypothetical protein